MEDGGSVHPKENPKQDERSEDQESAYLAAALALVGVGFGMRRGHRVG
jgi:hypothetical protein